MSLRSLFSIDFKKYIPGFIINFLSKLKYLFKKISPIILFLTVISFWALMGIVFLTDGFSDSEQSVDATDSVIATEPTTTTKPAVCNVLQIRLEGDLLSYIPYDSRNENGGTTIDAVSSEDIVSAIEYADKDENIKAIIMEIDSMGGYPTAAEEIANALKRTKKITIALIRVNGNSAAYWSATGANVIFASALSDIGSIGVTSSYLDNTKQNEKDGLTYNQLSIGKYKDMLNSDKPLTEEEKKLVERDLKITYENFIKVIAENRKMDIEKVRTLADGSSMLGQMALENGLIDKIGGINEVKEYLKEKIGEEVEVCK